MTIRKKIFYSNTFMVLASLLLLLVIGGGMISLFKDEFLGWYGGISKLTENHYDVYEKIPEWKTYGTDWETWATELEQFDFHLIVLDENAKKVYSNVKHNELEGAESLFQIKKTNDATETYFVESVTILTTKCESNGQTYTIYLTNAATEDSFLGMDRGMFEMFLIAFLTVGILAIGGILLCSQVFTKMLIKKILKPVGALHEAANRISDGNLTEAIAYEEEDEFKPVCDSFDFMQKNLREGMEQNAAYEKARTEMVSGISHDLRTPLTSVKGYIKGMLDGVAATEEKREEYLKIAYRKACDMDVLLSKLFYFSKLETGNMPFFKQTINIVDFLKKYAQEKQQELNEKNTVLEVVSEGGVPLWLNADIDQMGRVFDNLVENSLKYALPSGELRLCIQVAKRQDKIELVFSDNGCGVPEEKISHIFEQFYRGDEARSSNCDGNGLGLYVCSYIIKEHGGEMSAQNENGLRIQMLLPEAESEEK